MKKIILILFCCFALVSCGSDKKYAPKEGRVSVFESSDVVSVKGEVKLDKAIVVEDWKMPLSNLQNKLPNMLVNQAAREIWDEKISKNSASENRALPTPLIIADDLYVLDHAYTLTKMSVQSGIVKWQKQLSEGKVGLSLIYTQNKVFALSAEGMLVAMSEEGEELWKKDFNVAMRAPLAADKNALYLITAHNEFIVLNSKNGKEIWRYQTVKPHTWLTKMAPAAKAQNVVVVPFATGEVIAFDADSGLLLWIQMMIGDRPQDLVEVPQIVSAPIISDGVVYLVGNANLSGAYDLKTGSTKWVAPVGSIVTPILSGNALFVINNQNKLMALEKKTGKVFWEQEMPDDSKGVWRDLLLINNELILQNDELWVFVEPRTGVVKRVKKQKTAALPVTVHGHLLTIDAKMNALYY